MHGVYNEDGDGGAGGSMSSSDSSSGPGGGPASGGYDGGNGGYDGGYSGGYDSSYDYSSPATFNAAKDSQAANLGFGNEQSYGSWIAAGNSGSMSTFAESHPSTAKALTQVAQVAGTLLAGPLAGVGLGAAAKAAMNQLGYTDAQKASAMAALGNIGEAAFSNAVDASYADSLRGDGGGGSDSTNYQIWGDTMTGTGPTTTVNTALSDLFSMFSPYMSGGQASGGFEAPVYDPDPLGLQAYYRGTYEPLNRQMIAQVNQFNDPTYQAQARARAMADIQAQSDQQMGIRSRQLARMGVNPGSGRYTSLDNQVAMATAAAKVGAAANSDTTLRNAYMSGLSALNTQGIELAKLGNEAAKTKSAFTLGTSELGLKNTTSQRANALGWGDLAAKVYGIDKGAQTSAANNAANNAAAASRSTNDNLWGMAGIFARSWLD